MHGFLLSQFREAGQGLYRKRNSRRSNLRLLLPFPHTVIKPIPEVGALGLHVLNALRQAIAGEFVEQRDQLISDAVAQVFGALVGFVFTPRQMVSSQKIPESLAGAGEQRTNEGGIGPVHALEFGKVRPPQPLQQPRFNLIIGLMRGGDALRTELFGQFQRHRPTPFPRLGLNTGGFMLEELADLEMIRNAQSLAYVPDERGIRLCFWAELVVEVNDIELELMAGAEALEEMEQGNGVAAPTHADKDAASGTNQLMLDECFAEALE